MRKVRIGVLGVYRGKNMINYCKIAEHAEVVAICDKWQKGLDDCKKEPELQNVSFYTSFDEFLNHGMDAVVLANYATEHAPFAVKCLERGLHVYSEVLPVQTMKQAVELVEAVERNGKIYAYGENYCYLPAPREMRKLYASGLIGEFQYGEGEYLHNCEPIWHQATYGDSSHWRNWMYSTFYCTHSIGPILHVTGLRPVSVTGFENMQTELNLRIGNRSGLYGIEMITLENGAIIKSIHGHTYKNSVWYTVYGSKGRMESAREDAADKEGVSTLYLNYDDVAGDYETGTHCSEYRPECDPISASFGHGGSDYYSMNNFVKKIIGDADADIIDVYEALDMFLPGMFAFRSLLNGGSPEKIPDLRDKSVRDSYRNDTMCTDAAVAGDMLVPTTAKGTPDIPQQVYDKMREKWLAGLNR